MNKFDKVNGYFTDKIPLHSKDSLRRYFVDSFFLKKIESFNKTCFALDLGGNKSAKRGLFNIEKYLSNVIYLNFSMKNYPDIRKPMDVLREIHRILRPRASLFITVPFMFPIHADPYDYGRYTDQYWMESLIECGFDEIIIERQGGFFCVLVDMLRGYCIEKQEQTTGVVKKSIFLVAEKIQRYIKKKAIHINYYNTYKMKTFFVKGCTTGFGISCKEII